MTEEERRRSRSRRSHRTRSSSSPPELRKKHRSKHRKHSIARKKSRKSAEQKSNLVCHPCRCLFILVALSFIYISRSKTYINYTRQFEDLFDTSERLNGSDEEFQEFEIRKEAQPIEVVKTVEKEVIKEVVETKFIDMRQGCPIDMMDSKLELGFYKYDLFDSDREGDYFTGIIDCVNCLENGIDVASATSGFIKFAKCIQKDCSYIEEQKEQERCSFSSFPLSCLYGTTDNSLKYDFDNSIDTFDYKVVSESIDCLKAGGFDGSPVVDCPPCKLSLTIEMKKGVVRMLFESSQLVIVSGLLLLVLYRVFMRLREYSSEEMSDNDSNSDSDEERFTLKRSSSEKARNLLGKLNFRSKKGKVVTEEEFEDMKSRGETVGKKVSKVEVTVDSE